MGRKAVKVKSQDGFIRVTIPDELARKIDEFIEESGGLYTSRAEVVRAALRLFFEKVEKSELTPEEEEFIKKAKEGKIKPDFEIETNEIKF
ncbi:ribbon-helix-helix domain-containing protein [Archaeoglobus sp. UBA231]|mgnify:CR=1 FL=1|jgi:Arc/MetJ-type ribon-helix-helix transcriptional regulator|uniref:ribbon-helix-helix domain-containing protein n=1 Tax=Archaeoglobus sp. UBA231 TaxID=1915566 RepID=UPI0025C20B3F|nr:ribbon-helix-helix domain-containing protein [Archaeoglobus sp. UBA231]